MDEEDKWSLTMYGVVCLVISALAARANRKWGAKQRGILGVFAMLSIRCTSPAGTLGAPL